MALSVKAGTITLVNGGVADVESGDIGFTPKVVFFLPTKAVGTGSTVSQSMIGIGATSGVGENMSVASGSHDGRTTSSLCLSSVHGDACLLVIDPGTGLVNGRLSLKSFTTTGGNGFTLQVDDAVSGAYVVPYLALGGSSITDAWVGTLQLTSGAGNKSTTGPGFQGNVCMVFGCGNRNMTTLNTETTAYSALTIGAATSAAARWSVARGEEGAAATTNMFAITRTDRVASLFNSTGTEEATLDFVSFDATGVTLSLAGSDVTRTPYIGLAVLDIEEAAVGTFQTQTSTGAFDAVTGLSFTPSAVLATCRPSATATEAAPATGDDNELVFGVAESSSARASTWAHSYDAGVLSGGNPSDVFSQFDTAKFLINRERSGAGTDAETGAIDFVSFTPSTGKGFRLDQTNADAQQTLVPYLAFGATAVAGTGSSMNRRRRVMAFLEE